MTGVSLVSLQKGCGAERADSPWYPTIRLFRQRTPGDWSAAVEFRGAHRRAGSSSSCATPSLASHVPVTHVARPFALSPVEPAVTLFTARTQCCLNATNLSKPLSCALQTYTGRVVFLQLPVRHGARLI